MKLMLNANLFRIITRSSIVIFVMLHRSSGMRTLVSRKAWLVQLPTYGIRETWSSTMKVTKLEQPNHALLWCWQQTMVDGAIYFYDWSKRERFGEIDKYAYRQGLGKVMGFAGGFACGGIARFSTYMTTRALTTCVLLDWERITFRVSMSRGVWQVTKCLHSKIIHYKRKNERTNKQTNWCRPICLLPNLRLALRGRSPCTTVRQQRPLSLQCWQFFFNVPNDLGL